MLSRVWDAIDPDTPGPNDDGLEAIKATLNWVIDTPDAPNDGIEDYFQL